MPAYNVVRFRVKPGDEERFLDAHRDGKANWPGLQRGVIIKTAERSYCLIAEWPAQATVAEARSSMIATLNSFRDTLEDQGEGRGVTDAVSGEVVLDLKG